MSKKRKITKEESEIIANTLRAAKALEDSLNDKDKPLKSKKKE